jgi:hypothetical protein
MANAMSNHTDTHYDRTRATLFQAWHDTLSPHAQTRLMCWPLILSDRFIAERYIPANALEMAESSIWQLVNKDMLQFMALLERRELVSLKG